jgi:ribonuclease P protein subunit POP4
VIRPQNILRHEFIGLDVRVADSSNPFLIGLHGKVVDETRNMIHIMTGDGIKKVQKRSTIFLFRLPDDTGVLVDGSALETQPEKRIVMRIKRRKGE